MTRGFLPLALVTGASVGFAAGCGFAGGCDTPNGEDNPPISFAPSSVQAVRIPSTCGVNDPAFTDSDVLTLKVVGETAVPPPYNVITLAVPPTTPLNEPFPLVLDSQSDTPKAQKAEIADPHLAFAYTPGSTPSEIDATGLISVVVTVTAMPNADSQPLSVTLQLFFFDGGELDAPFTAPLTSAFVPCPTPIAPASAGG
jgi:hypothetical protein